MVGTDTTLQMDVVLALVLSVCGGGGGAAAPKVPAESDFFSHAYLGQFFQIIRSKYLDRGVVLQNIQTAFSRTPPLRSGTNRNETKR
jgi:hypothetical protein